MRYSKSHLTIGKSAVTGKYYVSCEYQPNRFMWISRKTYTLVGRDVREDIMFDTRERAEKALDIFLKSQEIEVGKVYQLNYTSDTYILVEEVEGNRITGPYFMGWPTKGVPHSYNRVTRPHANSASVHNVKGLADDQDRLLKAFEQKKWIPEETELEEGKYYHCTSAYDSHFTWILLFDGTDDSPSLVHDESPMFVHDGYTEPTLRSFTTDGKAPWFLMMRPASKEEIQLIKDAFSEKTVNKSDMSPDTVTKLDIEKEIDDMENNPIKCQRNYESAIGFLTKPTSKNINGMFYWSDTKQGDEHWDDRYNDQSKVTEQDKAYVRKCVTRYEKDNDMPLTQTTALRNLANRAKTLLFG